MMRGATAVDTGRGTDEDHAVTATPRRASSVHTVGTDDDMPALEEISDSGSSDEEAELQVPAAATTPMLVATDAPVAGAAVTRPHPVTRVAIATDESDADSGDGIVVHSDGRVSPASIPEAAVPTTDVPVNVAGEMKPHAAGEAVITLQEVFVDIAGADASHGE